MQAVAASMLLLFFFWAFLVYVQGCLAEVACSHLLPGTARHLGTVSAGYFWLNLLSGWFWWRHLDAALHSVVNSGTAEGFSGDP